VLEIIYTVTKKNCIDWMWVGIYLLSDYSTYFEPAN